MSITICCAQIKSTWEDPAETLARAGFCIEEASETGASLVCFSEQFATGWAPLAKDNTEDLSGKIVSTLSSLARKNSIAVLGSFRERSSSLPKNTAVVIGKNGSVVATYSKIHLFSPACEDEGFSAGDRLSVFDIDGVKFGVAICYDLRFPEIFYYYRRIGVDCVLVPAAWPCRRLEQWELLIRARALDNQYYVAGINSVGTTPVEYYCGGSLVAGPLGDVIAQGGGGEGLTFAEIDQVRVKTSWNELPILSHRREDLYMRLLSDL